LCALGSGANSASGTPLAPRFEHFVLETTDATGATRLVGTLRLGSSEQGAKRILESEARFAREARGESNVRVFEVEELLAGRAALTWREVSPGSGRTLSAEWNGQSNGLEIYECGAGSPLRERQISVEGALFPLYLQELVRTGRITSGSVPCFDPLARTIERLTIQTAYEWDAEHAGERARTVAIERTDGTSWASYRFVGTQLVALTWQAGGARARLVGEAEYERANSALEPPPPLQRD
jgi:hypothetical protein